MTMKRKWTGLVTGLMISCGVAGQQPMIIDRVVGVVGDFTILQSDVEQQYLQMKMSGMYLPPDIRCQIFNQFIEQKLLMAQAKIDSVEVGPDMVSGAKRRWKVISINRSSISRMTSGKPSRSK
jgi:peptidyl-prolyl cis-trans isomerase SurA